MATTAAYIGDLDPPKKPCSECPWRLDIETGIWPVEKFIDLTRTAYDMSDQIFTRHKSAETHPIACAGFLERGADHHKTVRLAYMFDTLKAMDRSGAYALYEDYRAMAIDRNSVVYGKSVSVSVDLGCLCIIK